MRALSSVHSVSALFSASSRDDPNLDAPKRSEVGDQRLARRDWRDAGAGSGAHHLARLDAMPERRQVVGGPLDHVQGIAERVGADVRGDRAAAKINNHLSPLNGFKLEQGRCTLCLHRGSSRDLATH